MGRGGISASQGRARGDGACRLSLHCRPARRLAVSLPAAFLLVAKLRLSSAQPGLPNPPRAGFALLGWRRAKLGLPPGADRSKISERKLQPALGYSEMSPSLLPPCTLTPILCWMHRIPPGVGRRQGLVKGSSVSAFAWWGWWHSRSLRFLPRVISFHAARGPGRWWGR